MEQTKPPVTFTVPLVQAEHRLAEQFRTSHCNQEKAKQVYLNTLAVSAVNFYLRCIGIETNWLQAKTWVRRFCALIPSFSHLKWMFTWFLQNTTFDFMSLQMYGAFSKIIY